MKRNMIIAALALAGGIASYLINRKRSDGLSDNASLAAGNTHHLTTVFSKAKQRATAV
ncbi:MAG: hypothetical protein JWQ96_3357 [Segetibacter sp.]|nr:hypothetical protein [Segetibacter sp.]